jgi:hypothetical protein
MNSASGETELRLLRREGQGDKCYRGDRCMQLSMVAAPGRWQKFPGMETILLFLLGGRIIGDPKRLRCLADGSKV